MTSGPRSRPLPRRRKAATREGEGGQESLGESGRNSKGTHYDHGGRIVSPCVPTTPDETGNQDDRTLRFGSDEPHYTGDAISCCNVTWHTVRETTTSPLKVTMADTSPGPRNRVVVRPNADG